MYKSISDMSEEDFIRHLEGEHAGSLAFRWPASGPHRRFASRSLFEVYHDRFLHTPPRTLEHQHEHYRWTGWKVRAMASANRWEQRTPCICLHPPTHQADCTGKLGLVVLGERHGPNAMEKLWAELDRLMDGLKATSESDLKYAAVPKAEASAFALALALMVNPANPDTTAIRQEAVRRWKERNDA